ncbi:MAG: ABC transporter ATP-binding protein, partial [Planctomycetota bacterium]
MVHEREDLDDEEFDRLASLIGDAAVEVVVDSDLLFSGEYGHNQLVLCDDRLFVVDEDSVLKQAALDDIAAAYCKDFVGNGMLEVRLHDDRQVELIRYSKTMADAFQDVARRINQSIAVTEDELEAQEEEVAKIAGPKDAEASYRCPNCGHPLRHPSDACPRCTRSGQVMIRLVRDMRHHWRLALVGMLLSVLFTVMNLGPGLLVRELVDGCLRPAGKVEDRKLEIVPVAAGEDAAEKSLAERKHYLYAIVAVFVCVVTVRAAAAHYRIRVMGTLGSRVITNLRSRLFRTFQRLSLSYYDREHTGRIMSRLLTDAREVQRFVVQGVQQLVIHLFMVVGVALVLFGINWRLAAIALLPVPVVVVCARFFSRKFRNIFRALRRKFATLSGSVNEVISGMRVVKSFGQEEREISGFNQKNLNVHNARLQAVHARSRFGPAIGFMMRLGVVAVWLIGGLQVLDARLSLGTLMLFITYTNQFYNPVRQLMRLTETFQQSATAAERIFDIMDMPSEVADHDRAVAPARLEGRIEFQDVSFGYNEGERVLKHIDLTVEPGEMIGLVGQTGSGKSTLVSLLCRFYDPTKGRILVDGHDLRDLQIRWLRGHIGMVLQDPF